MSHVKTVSLAIALVACATWAAPDASAQARRGGGHGGGAVGRAVPRVYAPRRVVPSGRYYAPRIISPRIVGVVPYRPYYYPYRPGLTIGFYSGYGYGYPYRYGYGYSPYGYGYGYGYPLPPAAYVTAVPGYAYGGVRIQGAPEDAQVFADGYYVGVVDDFDGPFQHLNLQAGAHRIEIRVPGLPPIAFDVNVVPGDTITYHAGLR
jgi:hypothetical protein